MNKNIDLHKHNFYDFAIFRIFFEGDFLVFKTFAPIYGNSDRFYVNVSAFKSWLDDHHGSYMDYDCGNYLRIIHSVNKLFLTFTWVDRTGIRDDLHGYLQSFSLDLDQLTEILAKEVNTKLLVNVHESAQKSPVKLTEQAQKLVSQLPKNYRRAFVKRLRRAFLYGKRSLIHIDAAYGDSLYFWEECPYAKGINGGMHLALNTITGKDGKQYQAFRYDIHT